VIAPVVLAAGCVSDLGTLGGNRSGGYGINEHGVTVGYSATEAGTVQAFRRPPGGPMIALEGTAGSAAAVNDAGMVVGGATVDGESKAVIWDAEGTLHTLADLGLDLEPAVLSDINDEGVAVGVSPDPERRRTFVLDVETATAEFLPFALHDDGAEDHYAVAINDAGAVVGEVCSESRGCRAVLWRAGSHEPVLLGAPEGWIASGVSDINDHGTVVGGLGDATGNGSTALWRPGSYHDPVLIAHPEGELFSGRAINNRGQVVGTTVVPLGSGGLNAVLWDARTGRYTRLGGLGGSMSVPHDINDAGLAVGTAATSDPGFVTRAVLYHTRR
jgi:probable HAF family extracellular repeat protein